MSYLVLARKYRPTTFSEVVGQEHVTRTLANAFAKERVHHAFLFCGPRGVGKTTLARILGKALNCEQGPTSTPCGECSACVTITNGSAVDYYEMDGASNRGIDSIRELTDAVRYQPAVLRKKVYVIDEVHMLTTEAFNALLKTLEEPPPHVSFVLATTEPHKIPNTILSRCQRYDFKLVPTPRLSAHITHILEAEGLTIDPRAISLLVRESGGSVRDALSLCEQIISFVGESTISEQAVAEVLGVADRTLTRALVTALGQGDAKTALEAVEAAVARGVDEVQLARAIVRYLRDLAVVQVVPRPDSAEGQVSLARLIDGSDEERADLAAHASKLDTRRVVQMFDRMVRACNDLGETQQPRLVLDLALIEVAALEPIIPLGDLLDRLGNLERHLARGGDPRGGAPPPRHRGPAGHNRGPSGASAAPPTAAPPPPVHAAPPPPPPPEPPPVHPEPPPVSAAPSPSPAVPAEPPPPSVEPVEPPPGRPELQPPFTIPATATPTNPPANPSANPAANPPANPPAGPAPAPQRPAEPPRDPGWSPANGLAEWRSVVDMLERAGRFNLYGYRFAHLLSWDQRGLALGFASDQYDLWADPDKERELKNFLRDHYNRPVKVSVRPLSPREQEEARAARSVEDLDRERAAQVADRKRQEVLGNRAYIMLKERFQPVHVEINTDV